MVGGRERNRACARKALRVEELREGSMDATRNEYLEAFLYSRSLACPSAHQPQTYLRVPTTMY